MTQLLVPVSRNMIVQALDFAQPKMKQGAEWGDKLYGASSGAFQIALDEAWVKMRTIVEKSAQQGWEVVKSEIKSFVGYVESTSMELGKQAQQFIDFVLEKIREAVIRISDALFRCLRTKLEVGDLIYRLSSVEVEHKLVFSAELETNLLVLCKLASEGELSVKGSYQLMPNLTSDAPEH